VVIDIPVEYLLHDGRLGLVDGAPARCLIPSVAVEFRSIVMQLPRLDARPFASQGPLANLLRLHLGRIAAHEPDELTLRGVIQRLGHELDRDAMVLGLTEDDAEVYRIAA
jgi:hypothetical protein